MAKKKSNIIHQPDTGLFNELSQLIEQSQIRLQSYANSSVTTLFWQVGKRINENILKHKRADYGKQIVLTLSTQLEKAHGRNFTEIKKSTHHNTPANLSAAPCLGKF